MAENQLYLSALSKAMALCSAREYCFDDMRTKIGSWGVTETDRERIISALERENFINEKRYAEAFARDKFRYNKWGKIKIKAELKMKKIPGEVISTALSLIDHEFYIKTLKGLLSARRKTIKAKNQYDLRGKLLRYGLSKGFESELLYDILSGSE